MSKKFDMLFRMLWMDKPVQLPSSFRNNWTLEKILKNDSVLVNENRNVPMYGMCAEFDACANMMEQIRIGDRA